MAGWTTRKAEEDDIFIILRTILGRDLTQLTHERMFGVENGLIFGENTPTSQPDITHPQPFTSSLLFHK